MTVEIEANRGSFRRQRVAAIGVDDWPASAIACLDRRSGIPVTAPARPPISLLTNSVKTWPDRFQLNRRGDMNRVFLFVS